MATDPLRALIWAAVSTAEQASEDKYSIPKQIEDAKAFAEREGMDVIDTLVVPGHSRREKSIEKLAAEMRKNGIDALVKLVQHWDARDFDVLLVRDGNRFSRSQSGFARIVEEVVESGARIYAFSDGWIDRTNYRMWIAMCGYRTAREVDELVEKSAAGMDKRASRGLSNAHPPMTHRLVRDGVSGKPLRLELREDLRPLFDDLAALVLEGVPWKAIEWELFARYGHRNPDTGQPYQNGFAYKLMHTPHTWGATARYYDKKRGLWAFDETVAPPPGVIVYRTPDIPVPPVYTGDLAERLKAELRRRHTAIKGRAHPQKAYRFTGLLVCGACGWRLVVSPGPASKYMRWYCPRRYHKVSTAQPCTASPNGLYDSAVEVYVAALIEKVCAAVTVDDLFETPTPDETQARAARLEHEITETKRLISGLIRDLALAHDDQRAFYRAELDATTTRLAALENSLREVKGQMAEGAAAGGERARAVEELRKHGAENFWQLPSNTINQALHRLLGRWRLVVDKGEIIGWRRT